MTLPISIHLDSKEFAASRPVVEIHLFDIKGVSQVEYTTLNQHNNRIRLDPYQNTPGKDISPELACEVIESIEARGIFHASKEVKAALADRMI